MKKIFLCLFILQNFHLGAQQNSWVTIPELSGLNHQLSYDGAGNIYFFFRDTSWHNKLFMCSGNQLTSIMPPEDLISSMYVDQRTNKIYFTTDTVFYESTSNGWKKVVNQTAANAFSSFLSILKTDFKGSLTDLNGNLIIQVTTWDDPFLFDCTPPSYYLYKFEGQNWFDIDPFVYHADVSTIVVDNQNNYWTPVSNGLLRYDGNSWSQVLLPDATFFEGDITAFLCDQEENFWVALKGGTLWKYDRLSWTKFNSNQFGIFNSESEITFMFIDSLNNFWLFDRNASDIIKSDILHYHGQPVHYHVNNASCVRAFGQQVYVGTVTNLNYSDQGIFIFGSDRVDTMDEANSNLPINGVSDLGVDKFNNIWATDRHDVAVCYGCAKQKYVEVTAIDSTITADNLITSNLFSSQFVINVSLQASLWVSLQLFDVMGKVVFSPINESRDAGMYTQMIDVSNLPRGIYFYRLQIGEKNFNGKIVKAM